MKVKRVKIGIRGLKAVLDDFVMAGEAIERGEKIKKEEGIYLTNFEAFRKALTPKRLELLHLIKAKRPSSINELARMAKRNVKNIAEDVKYLEQIGLIEKKESLAKMAPVIAYDKLLLEIAV